MHLCSLDITVKAWSISFVGYRSNLVEAPVHDEVVGQILMGVSETIKLALLNVIIGDGMESNEID